MLAPRISLVRARSSDCAGGEIARSLATVDDMSNNAELKARYPRIDDPIEAINFALDSDTMSSVDLRYDFLECWRDGAWDEIEQAYPEYLEKCK